MATSASTPTVNQNDHLAAAAYLMKHNGATALAIVDGQRPSRPARIITKADIARAVALGEDLDNVRIRDLHLVNEKGHAMKVMAIEGFGVPPTLHELPVPEPGEREVLVRVRASSVNGFDVAVAAGYLKGMMEHHFPVVLGKDFAGTVEAIGPSVRSLRPGDGKPDRTMRHVTSSATVPIIKNERGTETRRATTVTSSVWRDEERRRAALSGNRPAARMDEWMWSADRGMLWMESSLKNGGVKMTSTRKQEAERSDKGTALSLPFSRRSFLVKTSCFGAFYAAAKLIPLPGAGGSAGERLAGVVNSDCGQGICFGAYSRQWSLRNDFQHHQRYDNLLQ